MMIVYGAVANDNNILSFGLYEAGLLIREETLERIENFKIV